MAAIALGGDDGGRLEQAGDSRYMSAIFFLVRRNLPARMAVLCGRFLWG